MSTSQGTNDEFKLTTVSGLDLEVSISSSIAGVTFSATGFTDVVLDVVQARDLLVLLDRSTRTGIPSVRSAALLEFCDVNHRTERCIPAENTEFVSALRSACTTRVFA
jgi:hypothetical protein